MEKQKEELTKSETAVVGIIFTAVILTTIFLALFIWPPISYYQGRWSDYWNNKDDASVSYHPYMTTVEGTTTQSYDPHPYPRCDAKVDNVPCNLSQNNADGAAMIADSKANEECQITALTFTTASSTSPDGYDTYTTYYCDGIPLPKI